MQCALKNQPINKGVRLLYFNNGIDIIMPSRTLEGTWRGSVGEFIQENPSRYMCRNQRMIDAEGGLPARIGEDENAKNNHCDDGRPRSASVRTEAELVYQRRPPDC